MPLGESGHTGSQGDRIKQTNKQTKNPQYVIHFPFILLHAHSLHKNSQLQHFIIEQHDWLRMDTNTCYNNGNFLLKYYIGVGADICPFSYTITWTQDVTSLIECSMNDSTAQASKRGQSNVFEAEKSGRNLLWLAVKVNDVCTVPVGWFDLNTSHHL